MGLTTLVDELQRFIDSDPKAKSLISGYIAAVMGDLAIMSECLRHINIYQPWANMYEELEVDRKDDIEQEYGEHTQAWGRIMAGIKAAEPYMARLGAPLDGRFQYPVGKRRTRENINALRKVEANLDAFWLKVDESMRSKAGDLRGTAVQQLLAQPRMLQRMPEWTEPVPQPQKTPPKIEELYMPLCELYLGLQQRTERTIAKDAPLIGHRSKPKARGVAKPPDALTTQEGVDIPGSADQQPTFSLDNRALKVMKTFFYDPSSNANSGEVSWTDFLHAMVSTGFRLEKLYGSVWQFSPTRLDVERSIQFH